MLSRCHNDRSRAPPHGSNKVQPLPIAHPTPAPAWYAVHGSRPTTKDRPGPTPSDPQPSTDNQAPTTRERRPRSDDYEAADHRPNGGGRRTDSRRPVARGGPATRPGRRTGNPPTGADGAEELAPADRWTEIGRADSRRWVDHGRASKRRPDRSASTG